MTLEARRNVFFDYIYICLSYMNDFIYIYIYIFIYGVVAQSAGAVEYTDCFFAEGKTPLTSVLDMTLNNLMVRSQ